MTDQDSLPIAHSILSDDGMARLVREHYGFSSESDCHLLSSGYNEVHALGDVDGPRRVARLGAIRARGAANVDDEISMLEHVAASGAVVAEPVRPLSGSAVFFDFDDAAPGYLAYDLAAFLWNLLEGQAAPTERISSEWSRYPGGYRRRRELALP